MEKIEERLKAQDLGLMFNIKCVGDDLKCSEEEYKRIKELEKIMEGKQLIRVYIRGNVFFFEDTNRVRWFTFIDETLPLTRDGLESAENIISSFYAQMRNVQDYSPIIYSPVEGEFINRKLIANATEYLELL